MTRKEWVEVLTSESLKLGSGKRTLSFNMRNGVHKPFCSQCAVLGLVPFCEWCWYSNFIQGNFDLVFIGV